MGEVARRVDMGHREAAPDPVARRVAARLEVAEGEQVVDAGALQGIDGLGCHLDRRQHVDVVGADGGDDRVGVSVAVVHVERHDRQRRRTRSCGRRPEVERHLAQGEDDRQDAGDGDTDAGAGEREQHDGGEPGEHHHRRPGDVGHEARAVDRDLAQHERGDDRDQRQPPATARTIRSPFSRGRHVGSAIAVVIARVCPVPGQRQVNRPPDAIEATGGTRGLLVWSRPASIR